MTKPTQYQEIELKKLIEMQTPSWLTKDLYEQLQKEWNDFKYSDDAFESYIVTTFKVPRKDIIYNPYWKSVNFRVSPSVLMEKWNAGLIVSTPATGQDPKEVNSKNIEIASKHAGNHWGNEDGSFWIQYGTFNLVLYPNGSLVLEPTDVEHRLWGLIAFLLGLVPLKSEKTLYYHNNAIVGGKIEVNDLTLSEIVIKANENLKQNQIAITDNDIKDRFNLGTFPVTILPMYSEKECHDYYRTINSSQQKTKPQQFHAKEEDANLRIKKFSSIKNERFLGSEDSLHPFFKHCFDKGSQVDLETFMVSHLVYQYSLNNDFIDSTDAPIYNYYVKLKGYRDSYSDDSENKLIETLNYLYELFKFSPNRNPSRQQILQLLKLTDYLDSESLVIYDKELFINKFFEFLDEHQWSYDDEGNRIKEPFAENMFSSTCANHRSGFDYIKRHFLGDGSKGVKYVESELPNKGIMISGSKLPRVFEQHIISKSAKDNRNLDIDGNEFKEKPVGGHIISDYELLSLNDEQRNEVFKTEGLGNKFLHNKNCRAMSSYHNLRMSILRLSEYMEIINESDDVVKKAIYHKKVKVKEFIK